MLDRGVGYRDVHTDEDLEEGLYMGGQLDGMDDSVLDEIEESENAETVDKELGTKITILNTNARSLCPKIESLIDCFDEMNGTIGVITETWLADGDTLQTDIEDLSNGAGLGLICLNREPNQAGVAHGGVAVAYKNSACTMKKLDMPNPEKFEILVTLASLPGYSRKLITVACYLPPGYPVARGKAALAHIEDVVQEVKRQYKDPFIVVTGDFNQWDVAGALQDYPDLREADVGPTRKDRCLDRVFTNFERAVAESGSVPPLEVEPGASGAKSDHRVAYVTATLPRLRQFEWITYQYRYYNEESVKLFGDWLAAYDWAGLVQAGGSNLKAEMYQEAVNQAMERFFPLITVRRKSTDCPWINNRIRKLVRRRKGIYKREGRSEKWRRLKKITDELIGKRKENYLQSQRSVLLVEDARRNFFRNVKAFQSRERPKPFDVRSLFPGKSDTEVADSLASFFNRISREFDPLEPSDIPRTHDRRLPVLEPYQVEGRIRAFRKPKSMVKVDIFPSLMTKFAGLLAVPLTDIFNSITATQVWPLIWKREFVTVIPKCRTPSSLGDLRNISCTMLPSKIYESYVLNWLSEEVTCKENQYGGIKGCSVSHLLVDLWDRICWDLEDARAATLITAIDYAKAFNRLSFQHCLLAFARKGASSQTLALLATFLSNRVMSVRVSDTWSAPLPVYGGVPQGSILGVMLFNIATDDLEDDEEDVQTLLYSSDEASDTSTSHALNPLAEPFVPAGSRSPDDGSLAAQPVPEPEGIHNGPASHRLGWGSSWNDDDPPLVAERDCDPSTEVLDPETFLLGPKPASRPIPGGDRRMYDHEKWRPPSGPFLDVQNGRPFKLQPIPPRQGCYIPQPASRLLLAGQ